MSKTICVQNRSRLEGRRLVMSLRNHWLPHDEEFESASLQIVDPSNAAGMRVFTTIKVIAVSKYGGLWSAVPAAVSDEDVRRGRAVPTLVLKRYRRIDGETMQDLMRRAQREQAISQFARLLDGKGKAEFCTKDTTCIDSVFMSEPIDMGDKEAATNQVFAVMPLRAGTSLRAFLVNYLYPSYNKDTAFQWQIQALNVAILLGNIIMNINQAGIFHGDISLDTVLLSFVPPAPTDTKSVPLVSDARLVHFDSNSCLLISAFYQSLMEQYAAAASSSTTQRSTAADLARLTCAKPYNPNVFVYNEQATFRDPKVPSIVIEPKKDRDRQLLIPRDAYKKAELYSFAAVVQLIFDPEQNVPNAQPKIRKTKLMPDGVKTLLAEATGDFETRPEIFSIVKTLTELRDFMQSTGKRLNLNDDD